MASALRAPSAVSTSAKTVVRAFASAIFAAAGPGR
jgi:hypothetical protein